MRVAAVLLLCAGCGRTALPEPETPPPEQPVEPPSTPTPPKIGGVEGPWTWTAPQVMDDVLQLIDTIRTIPNTGIFDPILSEDGLSLFITTDAGGSWAVYALTRPSLAAPFDHIEVLGADVNATGVTTFGYQPLTTAHTTMAFGTYALPGVAAGAIAVVFADTSTPPFTWHGTAVNFAFDALADPRLTPDGTALVFANTGVDGMRNIFLSRRSTLADDFVYSAKLPGLPTEDSSAPWLSADRRVLLFAHADGVSYLTSEIWSATRTDADGPFTNLGPIAEANSAWFDGEPYVFESDEVCELYFVSTRPDVYPFLLYRSTLLR